MSRWTAVYIALMYLMVVVAIAQPTCCVVNSAKISDLEHRFEKVELLAERMARVETQLESMNKLMLGAIIPLLALVVERAVTHGKVRSRKTESDE